jgi:hypothetical protein
MRHQTKMEEIMQNWVLSSHNLRVLETTMGKGFYSTECARELVNKQERILKANGFVYRIVVEQIEGKYIEFFMFRKKRIISLHRVHDNWLNKNIGQNWSSTNIKRIEL